MIKMKVIFTLLLCLFLSEASAQLHHQMISSLGSTSRTQSGVIATQTIGQQSVIGNYSHKRHYIGQGYQQVSWNRIILNDQLFDFSVSIYPNPFNSIIHVKYDLNQNTKINIFDVSGKLIFSDTLFASTAIKSINLEKLSSGMYLVNLQHKNYQYFTKLIRE